MEVIWLLFSSVTLTYAKSIGTRRVGSDLTTKLPELYTNKNILRDLTLSTEGIWEFEDVNYEEVVGEMKEEHYDCYGINLSCLMTLGQLQPVCGIDRSLKAYAYQQYFTNICEIEYRRCLYRIDNGMKEYGPKDYTADYYEWVNDGFTCRDLDAGRPPG